MTHTTIANSTRTAQSAHTGTVLRAALFAAVVLGMCLPGSNTWAQSALTSQQIISKLKAKPTLDDDDDAGLPAKGLGQRPDPITRLCEPRASGSGGASGSGDNAFRNLVARPAPKVDLAVEFDFGKATLRTDGAAQLDALAVALKEPGFADNQFVVSGHTDAIGTADANDRLSCERALASKRYLADRHRIAPNRLVVMGYGASEPVNRADPRAAANRRVEIKLLAAN